MKSRLRSEIAGLLVGVAAAVASVAAAFVAGAGPAGCGDAGPWYSTTPDPDLSYLPLGATGFDESEHVFAIDGHEIRVDAYLPEGAAAPVVVFLPGASVVKERYRWLGASLASHGVATFVIQPHLLFGNSTHTLGTLAAIRADTALAGRVDLGRVVLAGHSAGCLAQVGLTDPGACAQGICAPGDRAPAALRGLLLLGYHNQNVLDDASPMAAIESPWLLISGSRDGLATPEKVERTFERLQDRPTYWVQVVGMNHYQLTDYVDPLADLALEGDLAPTIASRTARATAATYAIAFARRVLFDDPTVPDDLDAASDARVLARHDKPRVAAPVDDSGLPRVMSRRFAAPGLDDDAAANVDVVASAEYLGDRYLLVRNHATGASIWRLTPAGELAPVPLPDGAAGGFTGNRRVDGLLGAMVVFAGELYVGVSSGTQGADLRSTGAELWAYDGSRWRPVVSRHVDTDTDVEVSGVTGCAAADGDPSATLSFAGVSWASGQWVGAVIDDIGQPAAPIDALPIVWQVVASTASTLTVRSNDRANDDAAPESTTCAERGVAPGKRFFLRAGTDESGFGQPWNKGIAAMAVFDERLFVGTALNYEDGAELYATANGVTFELVIPHGAWGLHDDGVPISTSISALGVAALAGVPTLYVGTTGSQDYGARLVAYHADDSFDFVIDDAVDADDDGLDEAGNGHGNQQIASILEHGGRLWITTLHFGGFELLSTADGLDWRVEMGREGPFGAGWGDDGQLAGRLWQRGDELWVTDVAFIQTAAELRNRSAFAWRTNDGQRWQLTTAHGFGVNAVSISQLFALGQATYAIVASGALAQPAVFRPLRLYTLDDVED